MWCLGETGMAVTGVSGGSCLFQGLPISRGSTSTICNERRTHNVVGIYLLPLRLSHWEKQEPLISLPQPSQTCRQNTGVAQKSLCIRSRQPSPTPDAIPMPTFPVLRTRPEILGIKPKRYTRRTAFKQPSFCYDRVSNGDSGNLLKKKASIPLGCL